MHANGRWTTRQTISFIDFKDVLSALALYAESKMITFTRDRCKVSLNFCEVNFAYCNTYSRQGDGDDWRQPKLSFV